MSAPERWENDAMAGEELVNEEARAVAGRRALASTSSVEGAFRALYLLGLHGPSLSTAKAIGHDAEVAYRVGLAQAHPQRRSESADRALRCFVLHGAREAARKAGMSLPEGVTNAL